MLKDAGLVFNGNCECKAIAMYSHSGEKGHLIQEKNSLCKVGDHSEKQESPKLELNKLKNIPSRQPMGLLHLQKPPVAKYLIQHHSQDTNANT